MSIFKKLANKLQLYDPKTGKDYLHLDTSNEEVVADKPVSIEDIRSDKAIHGEFTQDYGRPAVSESWTINPADLPLDYQGEFINAGGQINETESVAYRPSNGYTYITEDNSGTSNTAKIYEYDGSGDFTGETLTLPSGVQHGYNFEWHNGLAWVADWHDSTANIHVMDWENKELDKTITQNGPVSGYSWAWLATVPTTDGTKKMIFADIGSSGGYLVDLDDAYSSGEIDGNEEIPLTNTFENFHNGGEWVNGYLIWNTHDVVGRARMPHADRMDAGFPIGTGYGIEWIFEPPQGGGYDGLSYNTHTGEIYQGVGSSVYAWKEKLPGDTLAKYDKQSDTASGGVGQTRVLQVGGGAADELKIFDKPMAAVVDAWFYDDGGTSKEAYIYVSDNDVANRFTVGAKKDPNYQYWTAEDSWSDTGVTRPSEPQWVVFRYISNGTDTTVQVSKDYGATFTDKKSKPGTPSKIQQFGVEPKNPGLVKYGHIKITPQYE